MALNVDDANFEMNSLPLDSVDAVEVVEAIEVVEAVEAVDALDAMKSVEKLQKDAESIMKGIIKNGMKKHVSNNSNLIKLELFINNIQNLIHSLEEKFKTNKTNIETILASNNVKHKEISKLKKENKMIETDSNALRKLFDTVMECIKQYENR
jgi:hypothetical protein